MKIEERLKELKEEYKKGQERLMALEQESTNLRSTMLRISGAIQVLEEILGKVETTNSTNSNPDSEVNNDSVK